MGRGRKGSPVQRAAKEPTALPFASHHLPLLGIPTPCEVYNKSDNKRMLNRNCFTHKPVKLQTASQSFYRTEKTQGQNKKQMGMWLMEKNLVLVVEGGLAQFWINHTCTSNRTLSLGVKPEAVCSYENTFCLGSSQRLSLLTSDHPLQSLLHL